MNPWHAFLYSQITSSDSGGHPLTVFPGQSGISYTHDISLSRKRLADGSPAVYSSIDPYDNADRWVCVCVRA